MNIRKLGRPLALLLSVVTVVAVVSSSTLAYITANSNTVRNTFRVEYQPPQDLTVPVRLHKTVLSMGEETLSPGGFSFCLKNLNTGEIIEMTSSDDGWASAQLTFTAEDVGKIYRYRLFEVNTARQNVIYDDIIYDVGIKIVLNEVHELSAELSLNGETVTELVAEFVNRYQFIDIPNTGDHDQPLLWLAMVILSGTGLMLLSKKGTMYRRL